MRQDMSVMVSSKESSWMTPPDFITKVTSVIGQIDLDPASSKAANSIVNAQRIYTQDDNALTRTWDCENFFLNPPFGKVQNKSQASLFCRRAIDEYISGNVRNGGIILVHDRSGYSWFEELADCLVSVTLRNRLSFIHPETMQKGAMAKTAQTVFLVGEVYEPRFVEIFGELGRMYIPKNKIKKVY